MTVKSVEYAQVTQVTQEGGCPLFSTNFNDIYYKSTAPTEGIKESEYVFLQGNKIPERWPKDGHFTIGETGFGTGLNIILAAISWHRLMPKANNLHLFSFEKFPLHPKDWKLYATQEPIGEYRHFAEQILKQYPEPIEGMHRIELATNIHLNIILGDINNTIKETSFRADCWFLDGFAPTQNPDMWSKELLTQIASRTHPGGTFSTFTSAGWVRRNLESAGFIVQKQKGHGSKREMLTGSIPVASQSTPLGQSNSAKAIVIGGGLAGSSISRHLVQHGYHVHLFDPSPEPRANASSNPSGILMPVISPGDNSEEGTQYVAYLNAVGYYKNLTSKGIDIGLQTLGVLQQIPPLKRNKLLKKLASHPITTHGNAHILDPDSASKIAGIRLNGEFLHLPNASIASPRKLCEAYINSNHITLTKQKVSNIHQQDGLWHVECAGKTLLDSATVCIICTGYELPPIVSWIPVVPIRGQITYIAQGPDSPSSKLKTILCYHQGYAIPINRNPAESSFIIGASFKQEDTSSRLSSLEHQENISNLLSATPRGVFQIEEREIPNLNGRASVRSSYRDHKPIVGRVPNLPEAPQLPTCIPKKHRPNQGSIEYYENLYISIGHGARGLTTTLEAAKWITESIISNGTGGSQLQHPRWSPDRLLSKRREKSHDTNPAHDTIQ